MASDRHPMNISPLQRLISLALTSLAVVPLCTLIVVGAARAADEAPAHTDESHQSKDWQDPVDLREQERERRRHSHDHGSDNDVVNIGHDSTLARGEQADSVVSVFGSATSDGEAGDVVSVIGDTRVTGEVSDSAIAVLGNLYIDGKVGGDAVAVLGNVELGPHAEIDGDLVAVGGNVQRDPAAIIHGSVENVFGGNFGGVGWLRAWVSHCLLYGRPLAFAPGLAWAWWMALGFLALYCGLALIFREGLSRCVQTFETRPGNAILAALITVLLTPVLVVLLCVTVIGIAAVPFVVIGLFCVALFGKAVMLAWLGWRVTGRRSEGAMGHPAAAVLIGGLLALAIYVVPVLGFIAYKLLGFLGLGAVVYTLIRATRTREAAREPHGAAAAASASQPQAQQPETPQPPPQQAQAPQSQAPQPQAQGSAPQPISAGLPRAGFWIRMGALLLDAVLVGFLMGVLRHEYDFELLVLAAYGAVMWKVRGSTIGGIVFDLRVVRLDGREIDWQTSIIRALSCFLSLAVAGLGFIWIAFDDNNQAWHDKIAGTVVVRVAKGVPLV
jgi:uncharacterized RDD family membrane protein YckC/cytoskeletal protein CcmA (bactofilin family)